MTETDEFAEIKSILDGYNSALELKRSEETELNQFVAEFMNAANDVIKPCMDKAVDLLKKNGQDGSVTYNQNGQKTIDGKSFPSIEFTIISPRRPKDWKPKGNPRLVFYPVVTKSIAVDKRTMGLIDNSDGITEFYHISEITIDFVKKKILELFRESYGKDWKDYF